MKQLASRAWAVKWGQVDFLSEGMAITLPDFLTAHPYGAIRLTGTRIGLEHVLELYKNGYSAELIKEEFDHLPLAQIYKVLAFYLENQAEVEVYLRQVQETIQRLMIEYPKKYTLEQLRERYEARRGQGGRSVPLTYLLDENLRSDRLWRAILQHNARSADSLDYAAYSSDPADWVDWIETIP